MRGRYTHGYPARRAGSTPCRWRLPSRTPGALLSDWRAAKAVAARVPGHASCARDARLAVCGPACAHASPMPAVNTVILRYGRAGHRVGRGRLERCRPRRYGRTTRNHHPAQAAQADPRPEPRALPAAHPTRRIPAPIDVPRFGAVDITAATPCALASDCASTGHVWITVWRQHGLNPFRIFSLSIESMAYGLVTGAWPPGFPGMSPGTAPPSGRIAQFIHKPCTQPCAHDLAGSGVVQRALMLALVVARFLYRSASL